MRKAPREARNLSIRSELMAALRRLIDREGLSEADAAERLHVNPSLLADLKSGKIGRFPLDLLVNRLADAGLEIDLRVKSAPKRVP